MPWARRCNKLLSTTRTLLLREFVSRHAWLRQLCLDRARSVSQACLLAHCVCVCVTCPQSY